MYHENLVTTWSTPFSVQSHKYALLNLSVALLALCLTHLNEFHPLPLAFFYSRTAHSQIVQQNAH